MLPRSPQVWRVAGASIALTLVLALALDYRKGNAWNPFELPIYSHLLLFQDYYAIVPFAGILLLALFAPIGELGALAASWCGRNVRVVALLTTAALAAGTHAVYHTHELSLDEHSVVFQSRIFAAGHLSGFFPPDLMDWLIPRFFQGKFLIGSPVTGKVTSIYWPGFALLLTPFTALGVPWLLNPLIGGCTVLAMHRLALKLFGNAESAGYVVLLTLASPAVSINAISYYAMPAHLLASALFTLLLLTPTPGRALLAGLVGSVALVLHNPVPHTLFALPWIVWLALRADRVRLVSALILGYLPLCLLLGAGWVLFLGTLGGQASPDGAATQTAQAVIDRLGVIIATPPGVGLISRILDLGKLWLWAVPALVTVAALGAWQRRRDRGRWLLIGASGVLTYFGYYVVPFDQGHGWGFRYFHSAWLVLPLFAASALRESDAPHAADPAPARGRLSGYIAACALLSIALLTSFRALQVEHFISRHLHQLPVAASGETRVVIIDAFRSYYGWDLVQNDPFLRQRVTVFISRGRERDLAMMEKSFPDYRLLSSDRRGWVWGIPAR